MTAELERCEWVPGQQPLVPQRIQLRRSKGWRKPDGVVVVSRPTRWGNPWKVGTRRLPAPWSDPARTEVHLWTPETATEKYRRWLTSTDPQPEHGTQHAIILRDLPQLAGRDLACWCPLDQPCHADVLLELANR